jgi:hypothetical protein
LPEAAKKLSGLCRHGAQWQKVPLSGHTKGRHAKPPLFRGPAFPGKVAQNTDPALSGGDKKRQSMTRHFLSGRGFALALILGACGQSAPDEPATRADFSADLIRRASDAPPDGPADACWARDEMPAIIETVTEQVLVTPERRAADGTITQAAIYTTNVDQRMVQEREVVWFQTPCGAAATDQNFLASLQRALKARGYYLHDLTGQMDPATRNALRRFQAERGLDSETLSLAAARELGLVEVPRDQL